MDGSPSCLFQLLVAALLFHEDLPPQTSINAFRELARERFNSPQTLLQSTLMELIIALEQADYGIVAESEHYAVYLHDMARMAINLYNSDLNNLRLKARMLPDVERDLIKEFKGVGNRQADIFMREVQVIWREVFPFMTERARAAAWHLELTENGTMLASLAGNLNFPRLVMALEQVEREGDYHEVRDRARRLQVVR